MNSQSKRDEYANRIPTFQKYHKSELDFQFSVYFKIKNENELQMYLMKLVNEICFNYRNKSCTVSSVDEN